MKTPVLLISLFVSLQCLSQSSSEKEILKLSDDVFKWEVENKIDSLEALVSEKFNVVTSHGDIQTKEQYLATLCSGNVKHDSIIVEQSAVTLVDHTAIVIGKGWFHITASGNKLNRHLSYMEIFVNVDKGWSLIALYASALPE